jgi:hypothetical protein
MSERNRTVTSEPTQRARPMPVDRRLVQVTQQLGRAVADLVVGYCLALEPGEVAL